MARRNEAIFCKSSASGTIRPTWIVLLLYGRPYSSDHWKFWIGSCCEQGFSVCLSTVLVVTILPLKKPPAQNDRG
jgi:hypothetical protein